MGSRQSTLTLQLSEIAASSGLGDIELFTDF